jgi:hypothetical protein
MGVNELSIKKNLTNCNLYNNYGDRISVVTFWQVIADRLTLCTIKGIPGHSLALGQKPVRPAAALCRDVIKKGANLIISRGKITEVNRFATNHNKPNHW